MSLFEDMIDNGLSYDTIQNKKKKKNGNSLFEDMIDNGLSYEDISKKRKEEELEKKRKEQEETMYNYSSSKRNTLHEIGTIIKKESEKKEEQVNNNSSNQKPILPLLNPEKPININTDNVLNNLSNMNYGKRASIINAITNNEKDANKLKLDTMQYQQEKETKEKANKINKDISNGNYSSAIAHVLLGVPQKALDSTSTTFASMNSIVSPNKISNTQADENELLKTNKLLSKKYERTTANIGNDIVKAASEVSGTIGGMTPSILSNIALPGSGVVTQGINVGAQEYQDTLNEDASNKLQATITGAAKGIVSGLIEKISGGNIIGKGSLDDSAAKFIESHFKGKVGQKLASKAYEMIGEIGEENLENQLGYVIDKIVNNKELPNFQEWWSEAKETTKGTFLTTLVLNALGLGGSTYNDVQDIKGQKYLNEAKNIIRNELNNNTNINFDEKTNLLNNLNNVNTLQDYNNYLKSNTYLQQNQVNKENNIQTQQIIQEQNKMSQNQTSKEIDMMTVANEKYRYTNRLFEESAKKYNIDTNNETVQSINKITQARGINTRFDADIFTDNNTNAIWKITTDANGNTTREVILNPNADTKKTLQNVIIHELTHDFEGTTEYKDLKDLILSYDEGNIGFENARKSLEDIYSKVYDKNSSKFQSLVDNEAVADILGNKLGDQDFINTLTMEKPSTARRIYNWVIDKLNKINKLTGYSNEKLFWADVKNKFENAYKQDYQGNNNKLKYSIQTDNNGNKYVKVDTDQDIFDGINENDYNKIAKMYMQDYLKGNTILNKNDKAIIGSKGINKYTNPTQQTKYLSEKMQLTPELKNVLEIAEKVQDSPPTKDTSKYPNWEYYKFKFELGGKNFEGLINIGVDKNGNKHFYEINKIHTTSSSYVSTNKSSSMDSINNSIAPTKNDVNTTTKYSIQESENNSGSFNLPKLKEGYTRLYRGLENKYDANYDKNKLDNSNGYESWTDNYELAKAYGNNVYYIDIPTSEIKNSIIDEDSTSETYGDRNLIYTNDKPIGIKGKSGNEYMLYTDHDNYGDIKYNSIDNNTSMQDNQGRKLTKEQQEYFKNSKIVDEEGKLKIVYHTTTNASEQFNIFDPRGTDFYRFGNTIVNYYTDSKAMSGSYADGSYEMAQTGKDIKNTNKVKRQYEGYINITNPYIIDAKNSNWNQIGEGLTEYGQKLWNEIDILEKNNLYYKLKRLYDKVEYDSKKASERFREIQKKSEDGQYEILGEYARFGNIDNIFNNGLLNDRGKELVKKHLNDKINGRTLKEIGLDLYNNKYDTLWKKRINEFKNENPIIKDFTMEDLDLLAENYSGGKAYIENRYLNKKTTNDIVKEVIEKNKRDSNYDGVIIKNVVDYGGGYTDTREPANVYVTFNSNQFKNIDNTNPTNNPDIRYSQNNETWQSYLDENYKNTGKGQTIQDVKLPIKVEEKSQKINFPTDEDIERMENKKQSENSKIPGRKDINLPKTKQELLENNSKALNKYIQERNSTIRKIEAQINQKQQELNSKENKDSIIANKLKTQIIELSKKKKDIELMYNKKIDDTFNKGEKIIQSQDMSGRKAVIENNRVLAREKISNIATWKDKSSGFKYQRETMERNMFDIIPDKQEAQDIVDTYFEPIHKSEAEKQKFINKYNDKIKELNLNKYESEAVQLLGEQKYNPDFKADDVKEILDRVNENIENGKVDKAKVDKAIEVFRSTYDELFELENKALKENGYPEKPYRKGYFPHFIDSEPITKTEKILDKLGFKIDKRPLPTDIAGITEQFVPGKTWNRSSLNRKTDKTTYNALKGFDTYISQATDNIFHTENIQKLRALENEIRYQYSDKGIQERIDEIYNNDILNQEEQQAAIEKIFEQVDNPMPNLVVELRRYTNALANKKSEADRSAEQKYGRQLYSTVNAIESRFGANAVGLNIGSAITNFIPITQAYSQVSTKNMGRATLDTIKSYIQDDGFVDKSTFLTNRINKSEKLYKTSLEKISDKTSFLFNAIDDVTSNIIVRGKYLENINNGMSEAEAIKNADRFAANVMADRSKGALPTLFEEKSPITKMFTQFQLEVNNQYSYMFKDIPRDLKEKGLANIALAFFKMFIAAWAYNKASEEITGRKPAFSPIDIAVSTYNTMGDSNTKTADKLINVGKDIVEEVPFVGSFFGGGRIPINGALPDAENSFKAVTGLITGEMDSNKAMNTLGKEVSKPLYYLLPPFGGAQAKKTIEGIGTVANGGSYGIDSKGEETLQFPVENANLKDYLKAALFGKYSLDNAKEYSNRNYKSLNAKQTKIYKEASIPYKELLEYIDKGLKKKEEKIAYLETQDLNEQQKWGIYKYDILSNTERDDGGSQLSDAEYMISNGLSKNEFINIYNKAQNNNIDIPTETEYKKMKKSGINLNNYIDYKIEVKNQTQVKRDRGELTQKQDLKNKDKIQILLDSKYSDKEITAIYENYIKNAKDTQYDIISKSGINIKEYLKYKQQEFESDKKEDGTTTGKTISGSKKKKEYSYVNSMNITYEQKLLLLGMNYTLTNKEQTKLANYVNNMKLTKQEKLDIYEKLSGFKVYKNGRVTW